MRFFTTATSYGRLANSWNPSILRLDSENNWLSCRLLEPPPYSVQLNELILDSNKSLQDVPVKQPHIKIENWASAIIDLNPFSSNSAKLKHQKSWQKTEDVGLCPSERIRCGIVSTQGCWAKAGGTLLPWSKTLSAQLFSAVLYRWREPLFIYCTIFTVTSGD